MAKTWLTVKSAITKCLLIAVKYTMEIVFSSIFLYRENIGFVTIKVVALELLANK